MDEVPKTVNLRRRKWFWEERLEKMVAPDIEGDYVPGPERLGKQLKACFTLIAASVIVLVLALMLLIWIYKSQMATTRRAASYGTSRVPRTLATWTPQLAEVTSRTRCLPFTDAELAVNQSIEGYQMQELSSSMCSLLRSGKISMAAVELGADMHRCAIAFIHKEACIFAINPIYAPSWYSFPPTVSVSYRNPMCPDAVSVREQPSFTNIRYQSIGGATNNVALADAVSLRVMESIRLQNGDYPCPVK